MTMTGSPMTSETPLSSSIPVLENASPNGSHGISTNQGSGSDFMIQPAMIYGDLTMKHCHVIVMVIYSGVISYESPSNPIQSPFNAPRNIHVHPSLASGRTIQLVYFDILQQQVHVPMCAMKCFSNAGTFISFHITSTILIDVCQTLKFYGGLVVHNFMDRYMQLS